MTETQPTAPISTVVRRPTLRDFDEAKARGENAADVWARPVAFDLKNCMARHGVSTLVLIDRTGRDRKTLAAARKTTTHRWDDALAYYEAITRTGDFRPGGPEIKLTQANQHLASRTFQAPAGPAPAGRPAPQEQAGVHETPALDGPTRRAVAFDVTKDDGIVTVQNPARGTRRTFRVRLEREGTLKGKRIVSLDVDGHPDETWPWKGFAFADEFGVHVWRRYRDGDKATLWTKYASLLEHPSLWEERGIVYTVSVAEEDR